MIGIDGFGYRREFEQFCPLLLRCLEPKEMLALDKCFWNRLSHYHDDATISHNNENLTGARSPRASGTRKETREQGAGKEHESSLFPTPLTGSPITRAFACHSKWKGCSQSIIFLGNRARSLFGEPVYVRNSEEKFVLFTY